MKTTKAWTPSDEDGSPSVGWDKSRKTEDYRRVVLRWESDDRKLMKLVRDVAECDEDCICTVTTDPADHGGTCVRCRARAILKEDKR